MDDCVFCGIVAGRVAASVVWEDAQAIAFMDLRQVVPGHVLVVPRRHVETLYELDEDSAAHTMRVAHRVALAVRQVYQPDGLNLWQSNGEAGGQEVPHFHLHVHPRQPGDGVLRFYRHGLPVPAARADLEALAATLRTALA
ncbi:HIT family protein [Stenotrophomonas sp. YIM B06876]|uniref:HIT family protein n=1 Tax=Stenotrophomonas sp. YIM B06876 TaxID=3060211 RepID=UPI0027393A2F|nr:HIT family protein [Stenotrophomonas sp. YIM B06876]